MAMSTKTLVNNSEQSGQCSASDRFEKLYRKC